MSEHILVGYATGSGSTKEVAEAIARVFNEADANTTVTLKNVKEKIEDLSKYTAVVLGSSIRAGRWLPEAFRFLETHREALKQIPVAYFTTCLTMVDDSEESRNIVLGYMEPVFQAAPEIEPVGLGLFAGSLDPSRQLIMHSSGPQGDYRNWDLIEAWAAEVRPALHQKVEGKDQPIVLARSILCFTDMSGLDLSTADLEESNLQASTLREVNLQEANLLNADLTQADLRRANLSKADLNWAAMEKSNMVGAQLAGANMIGADLQNANLQQATLNNTTLNGANLQSADLKGADLRHADLNWANLSGANLQQADLRDADIGWADLRNADLVDANLKGARYNHYTQWPSDFSAKNAGCILVQTPG